MPTVVPAIILFASSAIGGLSLAEAEATYWNCEYAAARGEITPDEAAACNEIFEFLKAEKFSGDFNRFLDWWRENKERELSSRTESGPSAFNIPRDAPSGLHGNWYRPAVPAQHAHVS